MIKWALKSLFHHPASAIGGSLGIAAAFLLVLSFDAIWRGESEQIVTYPNKVKPDLWVMQTGVQNMHMAMSFLWDWKADAIADLEGVKSVTPILYMSSMIKVGEKQMFAFMVGSYKEDNDRVGPWKLKKGRNVLNSGETVIPDVFTKVSGIGIGQNIRVNDQEFTIVGLSEGTYSSANPIIFLKLEDLEDILSASGTYSYLLIDAEEGVDTGILQERILDNVDKINVIDHGGFIENEFELAEQMGLEVISIMTLICSLLAGLIIGFISYSLVMRELREIAVIKALGGSNFFALSGITIQAMLITLSGFIVATVLVYSLVPLAPEYAPQLSFSLSTASTVKFLAIAMIISLVGTIIPTLRIVKLDPATVFHV